MFRGGYMEIMKRYLWAFRICRKPPQYTAFPFALSNFERYLLWDLLQNVLSEKTLANFKRS